jgi:uncharacterized protein YybS (DUF2232 family)
MLKIWSFIFLSYFGLSFIFSLVLLSLYIPRARRSRYFLVSLLSTLWFILVYTSTFPVFRGIFNYGPIQIAVVVLRFSAYAIMMTYLVEGVFKASKVRTLISVIGLFLPNYLIASCFNLFIFPHSPIKGLYGFLKHLLVPYR